MVEKDTVLRKIHAALEYERRINLYRCPIHADFHDGVLTLTASSPEELSVIQGRADRA